MIKHFSTAVTRILASFLAIILALWVACFAVYLMVPGSLTDKISEELTFQLDEVYSPVMKVVKRNFRRPRLPIFKPDSLNDPAELALASWIGSCAHIETPNFAPQVYMNFGQINLRLMTEQQLAKIEMLRLQNVDLWFTVAIITLGMFTTIFAGLNTSNFVQPGARFATHIKVSAILFPAMVTAATGWSALFASKEPIARQAQIFFGLSGVSSEIASLILTSNCPKTLEESSMYTKVMGDWNRRISEIVAGTSSGSTQPAANDSQPTEIGRRD